MTEYIEMTIKLRWIATPGTGGYVQERTAQECADLERAIYDRRPAVVEDMVEMAMEGMSDTHVHSVKYNVIDDTLAPVIEMAGELMSGLSANGYVDPVVDVDLLKSELKAEWVPLQ